MGNEKQRVVLFAGAGASKAVDPTSYPTTIEFFERLPDSIRSNGEFQFVETYLQSSKSSRVVDIEEILWALQTLLDFCRNVRGKSGLIGHALSNHRLAKLAESAWSLGQLPDAAARLATSFSEVISDINALVYDLYGESPQLKDLKSNWLKILPPLFNNGIRLDIFTTNYDVIIETAAESLLKGESTSFFGLTGARHKTLDIERWSSGAENEIGLLTKLHGSLDWKVKGEKVYVGDPLFTGDHEKQGIIYPGFKGASNRIFFKPFHDYFERAIARADVVVFIGFAFRDEYINDSIRNNLSGSAKVMVIDPAPQLQFPYRRVRPTHFANGFDQSSSTELLRAILTL